MFIPARMDMLLTLTGGALHDAFGGAVAGAGPRPDRS
jgi:hypothetical protein